MQELKKKYGLFTAICMVVGIVIGSGIFFKTPDVLAKSGYNALYTTLAWLISGLIMVVIATKQEYLHSTSPLLLRVAYKILCSF